MSSALLHYGHHGRGSGHASLEPARRHHPPVDSRRTTAAKARPSRIEQHRPGMKRIPPKLQPWFEARQKFKLSHAVVQMARELGMNPKNFGKLAHVDQQQWKSPLPVFIADCYSRRFGTDAPAQVRSLEQVVAADEARRAIKRAKKLDRLARDGTASSANSSTADPDVK
jgi:hypothetical protein